MVKYGPVTGCTKPCSGDSRQTCGGDGEYMFSLYRTDRCGELRESGGVGPGVLLCWYATTDTGCAHVFREVGTHA